MALSISISMAMRVRVTVDCLEEIVKACHIFSKVEKFPEEFQSCKQLWNVSSHLKHYT